MWNLLVASVVLGAVVETAAVNLPPPPRFRVASSVGSTREISCLATLGNDLWVGTAGAGMLRIEPSGAPQVRGTSHGLPGLRVQDCIVAGGSLWVATDSGLARWESGSAWFETWRWGRYLRLAQAGEDLLAARDDGRVAAIPAELPADTEPRETSGGGSGYQLEIVPLSLAGAPDGRWAAGSADGRIVLFPGARQVRVGLPVTGLAWRKDGLLALTPEGLFQVDSAAVHPWTSPSPPGEGPGACPTKPEVRSRVGCCAPALLLPDGSALPAPVLNMVALTGDHECKRQDAKCKVQNGQATWLSATIRLRTRLRRDFVAHPPSHDASAGLRQPSAFAGRFGGTSSSITFDRRSTRSSFEARLPTCVAHWQGALVVGTDDGLFQATAGGWQEMPLGGCPCGPRLSALAHFDGALWVGSFDNGLCRLDGTRWTHYYGPELLPSDMINDLAATKTHLYVATLKGLAVVDRKGGFSLATHEQCVDNPKSNCPWHPSVTGAAADRESGTVWVADTGAVHRVGKRWKHFYRHSGLTSDRITRVASRRGTTAVATSDQGVFLKTGSGAFVNWDDQMGLADNWVMDLAFDRSGALWAATCTRGVSRFLDGEWRTYTTGQGLADDYALSIAEVEGRIWVGTFRGVTVLTESGPVTLSAADGLAGNEVHDILEHRGKVFLATDGGLSVVERLPAKGRRDILAAGR